PVPLASPGARALELACGLGHNAIWLAEQGYTVDALDISLQGLRHACATMQRRGVRGVNFIAADLDHFALPVYAYDLLIVFRFLDRDLFPAIRSCVRPGGRVIYETLNVRHLERMPDCSPHHVLQLDELRRYFPDWIVLAASDEGMTSAIVAQKPE
ncbi:MAG: class I SAM-dependent methyltransferase, partial [Chloroflexi bacterium]